MCEEWRCYGVVCERRAQHKDEHAAEPSSAEAVGSVSTEGSLPLSVCAPDEQRYDSDGLLYTKAEFLDWYGHLRGWHLSALGAVDVNHVTPEAAQPPSGEFLAAADREPLLVPNALPAETAPVERTSTTAASPPPPPSPTPTNWPPGPQDSASHPVSEPTSVSEPQRESPREATDLGADGLGSDDLGSDDLGPGPQPHTEPQAQTQSKDDIEPLVPSRAGQVDYSPPKIEKEDAAAGAAHRASHGVRPASAPQAVLPGSRRRARLGHRRPGRWWRRSWATC